MPADTPAASWAEFETAAPAIAAETHRLIESWGDGEALLATIRGDDLPRIHPVVVGFVDGRLYTFVIARSPKRTDLELDGRFALHTHQDPDVPVEAAVRGRARLVGDATERDRVAAGWAFTVDEGYALFELTIAAALLGERASADEWPPRYTAWPTRTVASGAPAPASAAASA